MITAETLLAEKRVKSKQYFGPNVDLAIGHYNLLKESPAGMVMRNRLYNNIIHPAFDKLAENLINKHKFYYYETNYEDLKHDVVCFCYSKLDRYDTSKGKAYSFFTKVAYNELITRNKKQYALSKSRDELEIIDSMRNIPNEVYHEDRVGLLKEFLELWCQWCDDNGKRLFPTEKSYKAADSILEVIRTRMDIENFNKKALYILIRERAGVKTQHITNALAKLKTMFFTMHAAYVEGLHRFNWDHYLSIYGKKQ